MAGSDLCLVSACLLGLPVAYDGRGRAVEGLLELAATGRLVPVCPEVLGGLPVPRPCAEIVGDGGGEAVLADRARVVTVNGDDVTASYLHGARKTLVLAQRYGISRACLRPRSPSCGVSSIYDGTHSGCLIEGQGVTAALLRRHGVIVCSESDGDTE